MARVKSQLHRILKERGITSTRFSILSGVPHPIIICFDDMPYYDITHLLAIADTLNMRIEDLFGVKSTHTNDRDLLYSELIE